MNSHPQSNQIPPSNPPIGLYEWPSVGPRTFMPPWYPPIQIQFEPTNKLQYKKLQCPTYMKDTNLNIHIKVFKKAIEANKEIMEANIIDLLGFTLKDNIS
jgi:hypothetical protein